MILKMYTVYDCKVEAHMTPFFMSTNGQAVRAFKDSVNGKEHAFNQHPADYTLFEIGVFDNANASVVLLPAQVNLGTALEYITKPEDSSQLNIDL